MDTQRLQNAIARQDWADANAILAPVTATDSAHPAMLYNHGKVLMELGQMQAATALLQRAVQHAPGHAAAWFELGRAAVSQEDFATAMSGFSRALELTPDDIDARRNLGRVSLRIGAYDTAYTAWSPLRGDPEADLALYRIAAETGDPNAKALRRALMESHPNPAAVIKTLVRVSKGAIPLNL